MNHNFTTWFNYIFRFIDECGSYKLYDKECSFKVMKSLDVDTKAVEKCIDNAI